MIKAKLEQGTTPSPVDHTVTCGLFNPAHTGSKPNNDSNRSNFMLPFRASKAVVDRTDY